MAEQVKKLDTSVRQGVRQLERVDGRAGADTVRLWEGYREQATLWRALALLQMPTTALAIIMALIMFFFADTIIEVPPKPQPGRYSAKQLPDAQFVDVAQQVINLIATYQPVNARGQFSAARKYLWEPALTEFETSMLQDELRAIEQTKRTQIFYINEKNIKVERFPERDLIEVRLSGQRQKLIGDRPLPADHLVYYVRMTTIPRNAQNEYGIVVVDLRLRQTSPSVIIEEDKAALAAQNKRPGVRR